MEIGLTTFAETYPDPETGETVSPGERLRQVVAEAELAEQVGLDVYGVGEHHRVDFGASAPAVALAAIASRTQRIRLTSAVTVLSSTDPVRAFQDFATLDLLSQGWAELMAGRGSFIESFPLFGYDLKDYDDLFAEKLDLLLALRDSERVTWSGRFRPALHDQAVYPRPGRPLPVWVAVGGNPESVVRAGLRGLPMALAIIGGQPRRFGPLADLHRKAVEQGGFAPQPVAVHAHGYVAGSSAEAEVDFYPSYAVAMTRLGAERGWGAMTPAAYRQMAGPEGSLVIGSPQQVAEKILLMKETIGIERFMLHISVGTLPHAKVLRAIERLGTEVAPLVRG
ncbi:putative LLM family oxidoreductase [Motilibacter rhizosphaerae]|uniref:Putative LLM family oxidoreductase n=1 Tax=Motilibacter rhizosphaerae TaxID=598652 RepID=A0A4Q7NVX7_9ACTN|nr:putative LLM family oxidoreductase [Motilibacter rhizosphaerae]